MIRAFPFRRSSLPRGLALVLLTYVGFQSHAAQLRVNASFDPRLSASARAIAQKAVRELNLLVAALPEVKRVDASIELFFAAGRWAPIATAQTIFPRTGKFSLGWDRVLVEMSGPTLFLFETIVARIFRDFLSDAMEEDVRSLLALVRLAKALDNLYSNQIIRQLFSRDFIENLGRHAHEIEISSAKVLNRMTVTCQDAMAPVHH